MYSQLYRDLTDLKEFISGVKNVEEGKSLLLQKEADSTSLDGETEIVKRAKKLLKCLKALEIPMHMMTADKKCQQSRKIQKFATDVVVAYIKNCAEHHIKFVPEHFFQVGEHNIRHKINRIIALGNRLVAENPVNFDIFRRQCAASIYLLTYPGTQLSGRQRHSLHNAYRQWDVDNNVNNWDRFMVKLMIITHSVCTCLRRHGYTTDTAEWINEQIFSFILLVSFPPYDDFFKSPNNWRNVNFLKDLNPQVTTLNIPAVPANIVDIDDMEMRQEALEAFIPLSGDGFMGACPAFVPRLEVLAYSNLTIDRKYTGITHDFEKLT